jgi:hypothetical protein
VKTKPIAGLRPEIRRTKLQTRNKSNGCVMIVLEAQLTKRDLKKQSQFARRRMNITSFTTTNYDDCATLGLRKDNAKQSQSQQFARPATGESGRESGWMGHFFVLWAVFLGLRGSFCRCTDKRMSQVEVCGVWALCLRPEDVSRKGIGKSVLFRRKCDGLRQK